MLMGPADEHVDLKAMARQIADQAIADAETRNRTAKYASHFFRGAIESWAFIILTQVVNHERELIRAALAKERV